MADIIAATDQQARSSEAFRPVAVVVNGSAGALLDRADAAEAFREAFAAVGLRPEFVAKDVGTLPERVQRALDSGHGMVVVAGGDGTVACAAQVLAGSDVPLGILPFGTMNLLAKDLGIPIGDDAAAIRVLAEGAPRAIDVGEVNGHVFLCASMLGLPARLAKYREAQRGSGSRLRGWLRFGRATVAGLRHYLGRRLILRIGERVERLRVPSLSVAVNALGDDSGRLFARPRLDGGELVVYVVERLRPADLLRLTYGFLRGHWQSDPVMHERRAAALTLSARHRKIRVMNDGEVRMMRAPLSYQLRPRALRVMAPIAADRA